MAFADMLDSSHYYDKQGACVFEVPKKKGGGMRGTTIKDARELNLLPSVTTIFKILANAQLERWKFNQIITAALTLPRVPDEPEDDYFNRIIKDAFQQVKDAADKGSSIHSAVENHFQGNPVDPAFQFYADLVEGWAKTNGVTFVQHELRLVNLEEGYAGTTDLLAIKDGEYGIVDIKSRKTRPEYKIEPWATEPMQIASYAHCSIAHDGKIVFPRWGANCYLSTTEDGRLGDAWYDEARLITEFNAFKHACALWRHTNSYDPRAL